MKHNLLKSLIISVILLTGVSNVWAYNFTKGTVIYFDNTLTKWPTINLRVGTSSNTIWSNTYPNWTKVPGTESLYKLTLPECNDYEAFSFADNSGWTGGNNTIYQPYDKDGEVKPNDQYKITQQTEYFKWHLDHTRMFIPSSTSGTEHGCTYYNTTVIDNADTHPDYYKNTVNLVPHEGGTVTISYTNENGTSQTITNGSINVAQTCILTIAKIKANPGYKFNKIYVKPAGQNVVGREKQVGDTCIIRANEDIVAEFVTTEAHKVQVVIHEHWDNDNPDIIAYVWKNSYGNDTEAQFIKMTSIGNRKYECTIPEGFHKLSFKRFRPGTDYNADIDHIWGDENFWNQTIDLEFTNIINGDKCYVINNPPQQDGKYSGSWREAFYTVTLDPVSDDRGRDYGQFTIKYHETTYTSHADNSVVFEVLPNSTITIVESHHNHPEVFNGDLCWKPIGGDWTNINNPINYPLTVNTNIEICENFVVRKEAVDKNITPNVGINLFLKIPKGDLLDKWQSKDTPEDQANTRAGYESDEYANFVWLKQVTSVKHEVLGGTEADRGCPSREENEPEDKKQKIGHFLLHEFDTTNPEFNIYYCTITDSCWFTTKFERKHADSDPGQGPLTYSSVTRFAGDGNNCFTITGYSDGEFKGTWGPAPTCHIKVGYTDVGRYGIKDHNGKIHYAVDGISAEFDVPFGSQVEVLEGEPTNVYTGTIGIPYQYKEGYTGTKEFENIFYFTDPEENHSVTITRDTTMFDDLFVLKQDEYVYLGIPDEIINDWTKCSHTQDHPQGIEPFLWCNVPYLDYVWDGQKSGQLKRSNTQIHYNGVTYYQYTFPQGYSNLVFQGKKVGGDSNTPHVKTSTHHNPPIPYKNCFMLDGGKNNNEYTGRWIPLPLAEVGDYRVLYAEKELIKTHEEGETEDWETAFRTVYEHPSDIIKKQTQGTVSKNTVSLHITTTQERDGKKVHPMVILQQFRLIEGNTYDWVNLQAHTVLPLKATGNMGMLPGRKKAFGDLPFYDDGIEVIKNYTQYENCTDDEGNSYKGSGVWNFVVNQASDGSVELDLSQTEPYRGKYYIRTNNAPGYWENYKRPEHEITYSSYAEQHSGFSHYYCKWIDRSKADSDVSFIIANDYATNLSNPSYLFDDQHITNEWIPEDVNIRWAWEHMTNKVSRAYIRGTWNTNEPPARIENIVVDYTPLEDADPEQKLLYDSGDWIYSINLENMKVGSTLNTLTAQYPSDGHTQTFAENINMLVGNYDNKKSYIVRILYDFKIDKTLVALVPNENAATVGIDVLIERIDQGPATQVVAQVDSKKNNEEGSTVYGAFTFTQPHLTSTKLSEQEKLTYWFSFPFDVLLSDVYGFGEVGKYWMIKEYDGESRAKVGLTEDNTFWKFITKKSTVLQANKGYVLTLNKRLMNEDDVVYTNTDSICLYFPSRNLVTSIDNGFTVEKDQLIAIPQWTGETAKKEWNWNLIGIPSYANKQETITADHLYYFFDYKHSNDTYEVMYLGDHTFKSTFAYMVQFAGNINWHTFTTTPAQLAAQKDASAEINHVMRLELLRNNQREDKTYIQLTENENATEQFDMNFDLTKMANAKANLYSLIGNHQLAANVLPLQTTIVPLGVIIKTAGEYTFSMPDGTAGITAELIDYQTNTRTNLLLDNYTVTLPAGTNNSRFALSLQPDKTVTSVDNIGNEATGDKVKKYLIDGKLYLQKDGVLYDAQGHAL